MSDRLKLAFAEAAKLPEDEQDMFAAFLLAELEEERLWRQSLIKSGDLLAKLAREARNERARGETKPLDDLLR